MNAVAEMIQSDASNHAEAVSLLRKVAEYLPPKRPLRSAYDPEAVRHIAAYDLLRNHSQYFNQYVS
jgi:hypothetical protein